MWKIVCLIILTLLIGCNVVPYTAHKMNMLELGMTKQQVVSLLGEPISISSKDDTLYLRYYLHEKLVGSPSRDAEYKYYFVRFVGGKVESFGRVGDFDSAKVPETKSTLDVNLINKDTK